MATEAFQAMTERHVCPIWTVITRAVESGEITAPLSRELTGDLLEGPLMHRRMISRKPISGEDLDLIALSARAPAAHTERPDVMTHQLGPGEGLAEEFVTLPDGRSLRTVVPGLGHGSSSRTG